MSQSEETGQPKLNPLASLLAARADHTQERKSRAEKAAAREKGREQYRKLEKAYSTPLEYCPGQHLDRPRCSITIRAPELLRLSQSEFPIVMTLRYHEEDPPELQEPISFQTPRVFQPDAPDWGYFAFYSSPKLVFEEKVPCNVNIQGSKRKTKEYSSELPITAENDFLELMPGQQVQKEVRLQPRRWAKDLELGKRYFLLYTGVSQGSGYESEMKYWRFGTLERLKGESCDYEADRAEQGIKLPRSNIVEILVAE
ncbi:MAG: hypothetical protein M1827_002588 [Pycnora praestabilis]|nr:MAG: hypothetical protein M1827_002588 [Pycnora praestabilis]